MLAATRAEIHGLEHEAAMVAEEFCKGMGASGGGYITLENGSEEEQEDKRTESGVTRRSDKGIELERGLRAKPKRGRGWNMNGVVSNHTEATREIALEG